MRILRWGKQKMGMSIMGGVWGSGCELESLKGKGVDFYLDAVRAGGGASGGAGSGLRRRKRGVTLYGLFAHCTELTWASWYDRPSAESLRTVYVQPE